PRGMRRVPRPIMHHRRRSSQHHHLATALPAGALGVRTSDELADRAHRLLAHRALEAVEVELSVEVVDLVLEAPRHETRALDDDGLAVEVDPLDAGVPR